MKKLFGAVVALIMIAALIPLAGCSKGGVATTEYRNGEAYAAGGFTYSASAVESVRISWVVGEVNVKFSSAGELSVSETGSALTSSQKLHWLMDGTTLRIEFCKSGYSGRFPDGAKHLTVEIPEGISLYVSSTSAPVRIEGSGKLNEAEITATSGDVTADKLNANELLVKVTSGITTLGEVKASSADFYSGSGSCTISRLYADMATADTTSGSVTVEEVNSSYVRVDTTSGDITLGLSSCDQLEVDSTSGDVTLTALPQGGAEISFDHTSGKLMLNGSEYGEDSLKIGAGACLITVSTTSGDLIIE